MIKDRIVQALEIKGIAKEIFYVKIGVTSANFRGNARKTPLNSNAIENILSEIPDLSPDWLISGKGPMLRVSQIMQPQSDTEIIQVLLSRIEDQAQEIGKLKERLAVSEKGEKHTKDAGGVGAAAAG